MAGWYLMLPPWRPILNVNAPLSQWTPYKAGLKGRAPSFNVIAALLGLEFKDSPQCLAVQTKLQRFASQRPQSQFNSDPRLEPSDHDFKIMVDHARCIADDDPLLKGNPYYTGK